jgi:hypothetical protein
MSPRFISRHHTARRMAAVAGFAACMGITTLAAADTNVTALLRSGERVTGLFDGVNNGQVYVDVSATDERKLPIGDVAVLDFVGGAQGLPETELSQARGDEHVLLLRSGAASKGRLVGFEGTDRDPMVVFRTTSGEERRVKSSEVGRLYLGRFPGAAAAGPSAAAPTPAGPVSTTPGTVTVQANQQWTQTGIAVAKGQQVRFESSGEVQLSPDANDSATTGGSKQGRRLNAGPLPGNLAGALIGRVGSGRTFGIGNQSGPLTMPDAGVLFLGVNDDNVGDNQGAFTVVVTPMPVTGTSTRTRRQ